MKKWISLVCTIALILALLPGFTLSANAATASGKCGDNLTWEYKGSTITISGTGPMYDYSEENRPPWYGKSYSRLSIQNGVTSIGAYAFAGGPNLINPAIPASVTSIGKQAFANCYVTHIHGFDIYFLGDAPEIAVDAFYNTKARCYTQNWNDDSVKQNYGGTITWGVMNISLDSLNSKQLVLLNEELKIEDIVFRYDLYNTIGEVGPLYLPRQYSIGSYDSSTCGAKTVTVTIDGSTYDYTYFVTDGTCHLDAIEVTFPELPYFWDSNIDEQPVVTMWGVELPSDYYTWKYKMNAKTLTGTFTVTGKRIFEGFQKTYYFPLLKLDLCSTRLNEINPRNFIGQPFDNIGTIWEYSGLKQNTDFLTFYKDNINVGTGTVHAVGIGNCYGNCKQEFEIDRFETNIVLKANQIGTTDQELSDNVYIDQMVLTPAKFIAETGVGTPHKVAYSLYKLKGEDFVLVDQKTKTGSYSYHTLYSYDFSSIYNGSVAKGGEVFALSYSWVDQYSRVYAGMMYLIVPAKVPAATSMTMIRLEDQDYQWEYVSVTGDDGVLGDIQWTSSDTSVAVVEDGLVTMKRPGTATITAKCGDMVAFQTVSASLQDLSTGMIFDYIKGSGSKVLWDHRLLTEGTDYMLTVTEDENGVTVTATGIGWFTGELMKTFSGMEHLTDPNSHTHGFTSSCDSACNGCDFTRDRDHTFSGEWSKDQESHYHECTVCGEKKDVAEHILTENGKECTVCGRLWTPGDLNDDGSINSKDVELLLWFTLFPNSYTITGDADFDGNGTVNSKDVEYLLWHTLFPGSYPLK